MTAENEVKVLKTVTHTVEITAEFVTRQHGAGNTMLNYWRAQAKIGNTVGRGVAPGEPEAAREAVKVAITMLRDGRG